MSGDVVTLSIGPFARGGLLFSALTQISSHASEA